MERRHIVLGAVLALVPLRASRAAATFGAPWKEIPAITVFADPNDSRLPLVRDAVAFWNGTLAQLGSGFRLGTVNVGKHDPIPAGQLAALSAATIGGGGTPAMPDWLHGSGGHIVVALSDDNFVSFTLHWSAAATALVAIKSDRSYPLTLPNVARNVIAHELGHAIGLGHNSDPAMLMCGRPAPCRPTAFQSTSEHYFPLTDDEKRLLLSLYPRDWRAE